MNHLEELTTEWLDYNGYFTRSAIKVGRRALGGWDGELDVIGYHPEARHFVHVECSMDALNWAKRHERFSRKFEMGREYAVNHFSGIDVPDQLDQVVLLGFASAVDKHRSIGGGRLLSVQELIAEIVSSIPRSHARSAVPEGFPLLRTLQLAIVAGAKIPQTTCTLIPPRRRAQKRPARPAEVQHAATI